VAATQDLEFDIKEKQKSLTLKKDRRSYLETKKTSSNPKKKKKKKKKSKEGAHLRVSQ